MIAWLKSVLTTNGRAQRKHDKITSDYYYFASQVGGCIYDIVMGQAMFQYKGKYIGLGDVLTFELLHDLEEQYVELGYRIIPIECWVGVDDGRCDVDDLWLVKRDDGELPIFSLLSINDFKRKSKGLLQQVWDSGNSMEAIVDEDGTIQTREID